MIFILKGVFEIADENYENKRFIHDFLYLLNAQQLMVFNEAKSLDIDNFNIKMNIKNVKTLFCREFFPLSFSVNKFQIKLTNKTTIINVLKIKICSI